MKYLLSEKEYRELKDRAEKVSKVETIQKLCTMVAESKPIRGWWNEALTGQPESPPTPWGCIISDTEEQAPYCDECPVQKLCPYEFKSWSK